MNMFQDRRQWGVSWQFVIVIMLVLGLCFRFVTIDRKIYWHDEMYTSMRAAGFTRNEIDQAIFQNRFVSVPELQTYQQIKPNSTAGDTIHSLMIEDPQHPPLYFLMARYWMQLFGSSILASRMLPILLSLFSLPLMYGLAMELFASRTTALLATALLSLSPFEVLFAQTARQYSLLTVWVIASSWLLLRAMKRATGGRWVAYGMTVAGGLYTHPFFTLTLVAQAVYMVWISWVNTARDKPLLARASAWVRSRRPWFFALSVLGALLVYAPWIFVLADRQARAAATTDWTRIPVGILHLAKMWVLSFTATWFDIDFGFDNPLTYLLRLPFVILIFASLYWLYRRTPLATWLFVYTSVFVPFLMLVLPDLVIGGKRSAVSRYLISCFPALHLAVAYLFTQKFSFSSPLWRTLLVLIFTGSIISCSVSAAADSWWNKDLSYLNARVIRIVNREVTRADQSAPILLSPMGDDYTNMGDLVAMSYGLSPAVRLYLVTAQPDFTPIAQERNVLVFRPSVLLKDSIQGQGWTLEPVFADAKLWRIVR
jgi:uncharacterized membrane protein